MKINYNEFLAVVYADLFDWSLTETEAQTWQIKDEGSETKDRKIGWKNGYYFLLGREKLIDQRLVKEAISAKKKVIAEKVVELFSKIPTIEAVFLTGSVAVGNAKEESDIDLMIVTAPGALWLTRASVFVFLKSLGLLRSFKKQKDKICPNIFLDGQHLEIREKNLYTAHEVLQVKCLYDRSGMERKWLDQNEWAKKVLPNAYKYRSNQSKFQFPNLKTAQLLIGRWLLKFSYWAVGLVMGFVEIIAFIAQYVYMKPKMTSEKISLHWAFFHPVQMGEKIEDRFRQRLVKYNH